MVAWRFAALLAAGIPALAGAAACRGTVYLTLDTGHMEPAEAIAATLKKHDVKATFFLANEKTRRGDSALDPAWGAFWKARAAEGHEFGSHSWRHWTFAADQGERVRYVSRATKESEWLDRDGVCAELKKSEEAFRAMTGRGFDGLWRAPGGKTTPNTIKHAASCGYRHVGWTPAGFSGDELPSDKYPSQALIDRQIRTIRDGDILLWHLGIWSRKDPLYPKLDELIGALKAKGLCFARIGEHPDWRRAATPAPAPATKP